MVEQPLQIGTYKLDATSDESYIYVDEYGLVLIYKENKGRGDSIGRTMNAYLVYNDPKHIKGIETCWQFRPEYKNKMVGFRHPEMDESVGEDKFNKGYWINRMSRDHYINTLVALKLWEDRNYPYKSQKLEEIVKATPFGIRRMARWTLPLILWSKSLIGNKFALWWYLVLELLVVNLIYIPIRKLGNKLAGWYPEVDQDQWGWTEEVDPSKQSEEWRINHLLQAQPKWKQRISKIVFPAYALGFAAFQLYVIPNRFPKLKRCVQKSYLKMVGRTNYVEKMLLGDTDIPRDKVEAFKPMTGGRWSGHLNNRNDRHMSVLPDGKYTVNQLDVDLVRYLYNETQIK